MTTGSPRQLAKRLGVTDRAVRKEIAAGRIPARRSGRLLFVDLEEAEAAWHARRLRRPGPPPGPAAPPAEPLGDDYEGQTFEQVRAVRTFWDARTAEREYRQAAAAVVPRAEVQAAYAGEVAAVRARLLQVPDAFRQRVKLRPADAHLLEELVKEALEELGSNPP